jgi:Flp pilus assembly protein TadD
VNVLEEAIACHRAGDLGKAAELYLRLLEADDRNADAWHLMGLVASEQGQAADAVDFIRHAIRLAPASPVYHSNLGLALGRQERWDEAVDCYRTADVLDPNNPNILGKLGRALARLGKTDEAIGLLRRARDLAAHDADLWNALGSALAGGHHAEQAMPCFERALELDPAHDEARANLRSLGEEAAHEGEQAALRQDWAAAAAAFRRSVRCAPGAARRHFNLGLALTALRELDGARVAYEASLALDPRHAESWNNFGHVALAQNDTEQALAAYRKALELKPDYADARYNLGVALQGLGRTAEARQAYEAVLDLRPGHADAQNNLGGIALAEEGPLEAAPWYRAAIRSCPEHIDARWNLGLAELAAGNLKAGWEGYEARLERAGFQRSEYPYPRWTGEPLHGKRVHVWAEQGLGDTIQFARYLPLIEERGGRAVFDCQERLRPLMECARADFELWDPAASASNCAYHVPLLSLPRIFGTEASTIPEPGPRYDLPSGIRARWRRYFEGAQCLRVGLVWGANAANYNGQNRSIPLSALLPLSEIGGLSYFSLQRGPQAREADGHAWLRPAETEDGTVVDTAAAMMEIDLIITVDTMAAHLAATLGRPTWILLPYAADWRWMTERTDSPWYSTARLFRQPRAGNWSGVLEMLVPAVRGLAQSPGARGGAASADS